MAEVPTEAFVVHAPQEIDVATAPVLGELLADALAGGRNVVLDCGQLTFCDSTGIKVLLAARRLAKALEVELHIASPPTGLLRLAAILQITELLGLKES